MAATLKGGAVMAEKIVNVKLRLRTDSADNWININPVLLLGEVGFEEDTGRIKIGNGKSAWNVLPYFRSESATTGAMQKQVILNYAFPIGSVKITSNNKNPGDSLGGVWEEVVSTQITEFKYWVRKE